MTDPIEPVDEPDRLTDQQVLDYLRRHRDFFVRHPAALSRVDVAHGAGQAVSLIEHQVALLRERNMTMRRRMNELLQAARDNDELFAKTRSLTLALLEVHTWHELNEVLATNMLVDFEADSCCCHVSGWTVSLDHIVGHTGTMPQERFVSGSAPHCTMLRADELNTLFPYADYDANGSAVMLPLLPREGEGCLVIGSRDPARFTPDMDTLFVTYIADVLARVLDRMERR